MKTGPLEMPLWSQITAMTRCIESCLFDTWDGSGWLAGSLESNYLFIRSTQQQHAHGRTPTKDWPPILFRKKQTKPNQTKDSSDHCRATRPFLLQGFISRLEADTSNPQTTAVCNKAASQILLHPPHDYRKTSIVHLNWNKYERAIHTSVCNCLPQCRLTEWCEWHNQCGVLWRLRSDKFWLAVNAPIVHQTSLKVIPTLPITAVTARSSGLRPTARALAIHKFISSSF